MKDKLILTSLAEEEFKSLVMNCIIDCLKDYNLSMDNTQDEEIYLTKHQAAKIAKVASSTIDNWGRAEYITRYYFGSSVRFKKEELLQYLASRNVNNL